MPSVARWTPVLVLLLISSSLVVATAATHQQDDQQNVGNGLSETDQDRLNLVEHPQATFRNFLAAMDEGDFDKARQCLDLSGLGPDVQLTKGNIYCDRLHQVLKELWDETFHTLPADPNHASPFDLASRFITGNDEQREEDAKRIRLIRNEKGMWLFAPSTLEAVDGELWERWHDPSVEARSIPVWLEKNLPAWTLQKTFILKNYQWACLVLLVLAGFAIGFVMRRLLDILTRLVLTVRRLPVDDRRRIILWQPISLLAHAATWYYGSRLFDLPAGFQNVLFTCFRLFAVIALVWTGYRFVDLIVSYLIRRALRTESRFDDTLTPIIGSFLKILVTISGIILLVNFLGWEDWGAVLGGFGVGGIAIAIAAKDVIGNFFGSLTVLTDRPFEIGDWVVVDGEVEGTIERVGIRSSRIRTFYESEAIVPNVVLTTAVVDNMGRRNYRRLKVTVQLRSETSAADLDQFCVRIREMLAANSKVRKESCHIYVHDITENSINIMVYCFLICPDWTAELQERHSILTGIIAIAEEMELRLANSFKALSFSVDDSQSKSA